MEAQEEEHTQKRIGWGSIALALSITWILLNRSNGNVPSLADQIITTLGGKAWSAGKGGLHYTPFYTLPILLLATAIGFSFPKDIGATLGRNVGILLSLGFFVVGLFIISTG